MSFIIVVIIVMIFVIVVILIVVVFVIRFPKRPESLLASGVPKRPKTAPGSLGPEFVCSLI